MELCSLHPFDEEAVREFVTRVESTGGGERSSIELARRALQALERGEERGQYDLTYALAQELAARHPSFSAEGFSLTAWEARVDRGVGMLMRPPSRLLIDAGLQAALARSLPIRLDLSRGMMGGAFIPARLVPDLERLLDARLERMMRRLIEAEWNGVELLGLMFEAVSYARTHRLGIYEAMDVVGPAGDVPGVPAGRVLTADTRRLDKALRRRLEAAAKPPKKPGLLARLTRRAKPETYGFPDEGETR